MTVSKDKSSRRDNAKEDVGGSAIKRPIEKKQKTDGGPGNPEGRKESRGRGNKKEKNQTTEAATAPTTAQKQPAKPKNPQQGVPKREKFPAPTSRPAKYDEVPRDKPKDVPGASASDLFPGQSFEKSTFAEAIEVEENNVAMEAEPETDATSTLEPSAFQRSGNQASVLFQQGFDEPKNNRNVYRRSVGFRAKDKDISMPKSSILMPDHPFATGFQQTKATAKQGWFHKVAAKTASFFNNKSKQPAARINTVEVMDQDNCGVAPSNFPEANRLVDECQDNCDVDMQPISDSVVCMSNGFPGTPFGRNRTATDAHQEDQLAQKTSASNEKTPVKRPAEDEPSSMDSPSKYAKLSTPLRCLFPQNTPKGSRRLDASTPKCATNPC